MNVTAIVFAKEFVENLRDRRTMLIALVVAPFFGPLLFGLMLQSTIDRGSRDGNGPVALSVIHAEAAPQLVAHLESRGIEVRPIEAESMQARDLVRAGGARMVLEIPTDIGPSLQQVRPAGLRLYADASNRESQRDVERTRVLIAAYAQEIATQRLILRGIDPSVLAPLVVQDVDVSTPAGRAASVVGLLSFFLILALMTGGMYLAIDTTVGERERGTLESLLATPVERESLLVGKLATTATFMLLALMLTTVSFFFVLSRVNLEELGMSANLGPITALKIIGVTAPLIPAAAALLTLVAAFTRSAREAQAWLSVTQLLPTLPLVFAGMANLSPSPALMLVPSLSQHFLIMRLLRAEPIAYDELAASIASSLILGVVLLIGATRIYRRERLLA